MRRQRMSKFHSRKNFTKNADRIHVKNTYSSPMRGGIRL